MSAVVTDTHALLWFLGDSSKLSRAAFQALENAEQEGLAIYVPAIVLVELRIWRRRAAIFPSRILR